MKKDSIFVNIGKGTRTCTQTKGFGDLHTAIILYPYWLRRLGKLDSNQRPEEFRFSTLPLSYSPIMVPTPELASGYEALQATALLYKLSWHWLETRDSNPDLAINSRLHRPAVLVSNDGEINEN